MRISSDTMLSQVVRVVLLPLCVAGVAVPGNAGLHSLPKSF